MINKEKIFENVKLKISISNFDEEENIEMKKNNKTYIFKVATVACCMLVLTTVVFAKDIENYIKKIFNNSTEGINSAVENEYVQNEDMEFVYNNDIGIKVDNLVLDDLNLAVSFELETKREDIKSIWIEQYVISNDNNELIYEYENKDTVKIGLANTITRMKEPEKVTDTIFTDSMLFGLRQNVNDFNKLNFEIKSLKLTYNDDTVEVLKGMWKFDIEIKDDMKKSENIYYNLSESNEYIESCTGTLSATGMIIEVNFTSRINFELLQDKRIIAELKSGSEKYAVSYVEGNLNQMILHFDNIGKYFNIDNTLDLYLEIYDTTIVLTKKDI